MSTTLSRPALRYHGGKWMLAPWIIGQMPSHRVYTEAFGGAASVLLRKPRAYAEVYNDLDGEVVNLFRVLRDPDKSLELERMLRLTPYAREEFRLAHQVADTDIERARRIVVRSWMGYAGSSTCNLERSAGFAMDGKGASGTSVAHDWHRFPYYLQGLTRRLQGVVIENRPALDVITQNDGLEALHFVDPPYVMSTRGDALADYRHEMSDDDHRALAEVLRGLSGMVMLCGYPSALYDELYGDWECRTRRALAADIHSERRASVRASSALSVIVARSIDWTTRRGIVTRTSR
jgi:DNA adenine methylase